jgi:hypothetical protein
LEPLISARIIAFPGRIDHSQEVVESAQLVRAIALDVFERNDAWHRIVAFEKAIKTIPGGRDDLHRYIAVFGSDPYELAVSGPATRTLAGGQTDVISISRA